MKRSRTLALLLVLLAALGLTWGTWVARRALPPASGDFDLSGIPGRAEIIRDRWGVPHVFAESDDAAYFALGWATAQDRLFQLELNRRLAQGRLSEIFGKAALKTDTLFRTMDFAGTAKRMVDRARPEARSAGEAYAHGVNAWVEKLGGRLPPEFAILGISFEPAKADDFVGILGFMAWNLNLSWNFDPLYERLVEKVGEERALELFPYNKGAKESVYPPPAGRLKNALGLFDLSPFEAALVSSGPSLSGSNNWVVGPKKSATGRPILCNDPHLSHSLPGIWYLAHLKTPTQDVAGVTIPGFPLVILGHNRDIAWGMTNLMLDGADFFVEKVEPGEPGRVMSNGAWVPLKTRTETIVVKGEPSRTVVVKSTPHGPLVSDLMEGEGRALSYCWNFHHVEDGGEVDAFYALDRAKGWEDFRAAARGFASVAQNVAYADREGHIGMQTVGAIPRFRGRMDGLRFRTGWDGSEDWDGYVPFEEHPFSFDPPEGFLASANNPTVRPPAPYYISSQWEPVDRHVRIRELLEAKETLGVEDMERIQFDTVVPAARSLARRLLEASEREPPKDPLVRQALETLRGWDGSMSKESPAASLFSVVYRRLFYEIFEETLGKDLTKAYRARANVSMIMMQAVLEEGHESWFLRPPPRKGGKDAILMETLEKSVFELRDRLGDSPLDWQWGRLHTLEFQHPLGRASRLLGFYFDRGPFPVPGHNLSVNKMEFDETSFRVLHGPSVRLITDFSNLNGSLAVLPAGESGIPSSPHYSDLMNLWLTDGYHPLPMDRESIEKVAEGHQMLSPRATP